MRAPPPGSFTSRAPSAAASSWSPTARKSTPRASWDCCCSRRRSEAGSSCAATAPTRARRSPPSRRWSPTASGRGGEAVAPMTPKRPMQVIPGFAASAGIAIGRAVVIANRALEVFRIPLPEAEIVEEIARFRAACLQTQQQIHRTRARAGDLFGQELAAIFDAHSLLLADRSFLQQIEQKIRVDHVNAEWAVHETTREVAKKFAGLETDYLRERGEDLEDVGRQLLRTLQGLAHHDISEVEGDVILVADDLVPSEAIRLAREKVVGFAIEAGGRTSHTTIIARSLGVPAVI